MTAVATQRGMTSASTAIAPSGPQISGLTSSASMLVAELGGELGEAGDSADDRAEIGGRGAADAGQQLAHLQPGHQPGRLLRR